MEKRRLLYVRTAPSEAPSLDAVLPDWEVHSHTFAQAQRGEAYRFPVAIVLIDTATVLPQLEELLAAAPATQWIVIAPPRLLDDAMLRYLIHAGCFDYHTLPIDPMRLRLTLGHAYGMARLRHGADQMAPPPLQDDMVAVSAPMQRLLEQIVKVAKVEAPVLIQGESGSGKELAAKAVHARSARAAGPFIAVNCGALPATLVQSELFGHEKGAFTGANQRKIGRVEAAAGGTIFLDEIGDLPLELQVNLLRFLQEGTIERLGSTVPVPVDVRVIAATHVNLEEAVAQKRFRADLYYRLNVLRLDVPSLRERGGEVALLARYFFDRFAGDRNPVVRGFGQDALEAMQRHTWPGNVRELINRIRRAMVMCDRRLIGAADLGLDRDATRPRSLAQVRATAERDAVEQALRRTGGNISQAAAQLGVTRVTLYRMLEKLRISSAAYTRATAGLAGTGSERTRGGVGLPL